MAPAADQHAAVRGIFDGVGDEVLQQPPQQQPVGFHRQRAGHEGQLQPLGACGGRKFDFQRAHQVAHLEARDRRRHGAGVEPRDIQQRAEDFLDRLERIVDVFDQPRILAAVLALDQARDVEPRRVQRLQDVVAGGGQKARLRDVGVLGRAFGQREFRIQPREFLGAVAHALFQRRVGAFQRFGGLERRGDVGEGDDEIAARHPVGAHLDHHVAIRQTLQIRLALGGVGGQPPFHQRVALVEGRRADRAHEFEDFPQRDPDLHQMRRQPEDFAELPVRADQLQIRVEHGDALPHMVQRGLQDLAVEMQRGVGIVEQFQRGLGGDGALAQQQRHHQARGGRADRGCDQMLGMLQQLEIGRGGRIESGVMRRREGLERIRGRGRGRDTAPPCSGCPAPSRWSPAPEASA